MIAAPLLLLASTIVSLTGGGLVADRAGGAIQVYAFAAFFLVVIGTVRLLEPRMPRGAALLTLTGSLGAAAGVAFGIERIANDMTGLRLAEAGGASIPFALLAPGLLFPLTMLGIGLALRSTRACPRWNALALALAGVLFPVSRIGEIDALAIVADIMFVIALVPLGRAMLSRRPPAGSSPPSHRERIGV